MGIRGDSVHLAICREGILSGGILFGGLCTGGILFWWRTRGGYVRTPTNFTTSFYFLYMRVIELDTILIDKYGLETIVTDILFHSYLSLNSCS